MTSPNLTIQCMNAYIQGSAGFTCAKQNHTNFKSVHCPLWTTCLLCSSSDHICALWFHHRSNSKSPNLRGKLIQPSLWGSSQLMRHTQQFSVEEHICPSPKVAHRVKCTQYSLQHGLVHLEFVPQADCEQGVRVPRTFAANDQHCGMCYWAKWKNQEPNQQNLCSAPALLASFRSLGLCPLPPNEIQTQRRIGVRSAGSSAELLTWSATLHPDAAVELLVDSLALGHKFMMHNLIVEFVVVFLTVECPYPDACDRVLHLWAWNCGHFHWQLLFGLWVHQMILSIKMESF